jgi:hypothetical protein
LIEYVILAKVANRAADYAPYQTSDEGAWPQLNSAQCTFGRTDTRADRSASPPACPARSMQARRDSVSLNFALITRDAFCIRDHSAGSKKPNRPGDATGYAASEDSPACAMLAPLS